MFKAKSPKTAAAARRVFDLLDNAPRDAKGRVLVDEAKINSVLRSSGLIPLREAGTDEHAPSIFDMALADAKARMPRE